MSNMAPAKTVRRAFRLDPELDELLQAKAKELDRSVSWVVNCAVEKALLSKGDRPRTEGPPMSGETVNVPGRRALEAVEGLRPVLLCRLCRSGAGGECHMPGCALYNNRAPDMPVRYASVLAFGGDQR
jgi:hypothetical protein